MANNNNIHFNTFNGIGGDVEMSAKEMFEKLGYKVEPRYNEPRADIVQNIIFNDENKF